MGSGHVLLEEQAVVGEACSKFGIMVQVRLFSIVVYIFMHKSFLNCRYSCSIIIKNLTHAHMKLLSFSCQCVYLQLHQ